MYSYDDIILHVL